MMQPGVATKLRAVVLLGFAAAGCAGAPAYDPGNLSKEQVARCRAVETAYRANSPDYPALRDDVARDPVAAAWIVRMLVRDVFTAREGQPLGEDTEFLRAAAGIENPLETRAIAEIKQLGVVAVPALVGDLLKHEQPLTRELGIELLADVGQPAIPALQEVVRTGDSKQQRAAARALGRIGIDDTVFATLRDLTRHGDFTVRADALRSLRGGGARAQQLLIDRLRADDDAFVRRVAAQTLAHFPSRASGTALADFLERCERENDRDGQRSAHLSLQAVTGEQPAAGKKVVVHTAPQWRSLVAKLGDLPVADAPGTRPR